MNNELIKELLIKAGVYECDVNDPEFVVPEEQRKFAELIVEECMNSIYAEKDNETCIDDWDFRYEAGLTAAILFIEEHFYDPKSN